MSFLALPTKQHLDLSQNAPLFMGQDTFAGIERFCFSINFNKLNNLITFLVDKNIRYEILEAV